jgi:hypothetical protein
MQGKIKKSKDSESSSFRSIALKAILTYLASLLVTEIVIAVEKKFDKKYN